MDVSFHREELRFLGGVVYEQSVNIALYSGACLNLEVFFSSFGENADCGVYAQIETRMKHRTGDGKSVLEVFTGRPSMRFFVKWSADENQVRGFGDETIRTNRSKL